MKNLVYYTVGCSASYIDILQLSVSSLHKSGWAGDIAVLCDESFLGRCKQILGTNVQYLTLPDSTTPEQASMNKLRIFELPTIDDYDRVLFLDSDIVVDMDVNSFFSRVDRDGILYVYTETQNQEDHMSLYWSLQSYTESELASFKANSVYVFNAGCFAFVRSNTMKGHFTSIQYTIMNHVGAFFYEQSFMNVYFNRNGQTDRSLLTSDIYAFQPKPGVAYPNRIIHFAGYPGVGLGKHQRMTAYMDSYLLK
jgi:lipopolysaccharide biosynthesis glycosyltransferase